MATRARFVFSVSPNSSRTDLPEPRLSHRQSKPVLPHCSPRARHAELTFSSNARRVRSPFLIEQEERFPERAGHIDTRPGTHTGPELEPATPTAAEALTERSDS